jgi:hypothetical protein
MGVRETRVLSHALRRYRIGNAALASAAPEVVHRMPGMGRPGIADAAGYGFEGHHLCTSLRPKEVSDAPVHRHGMFCSDVHLEHANGTAAQSNMNKDIVCMNICANAQDPLALGGKDRKYDNGRRARMVSEAQSGSQTELLTLQ